MNNNKQRKIDNKFQDTGKLFLDTHDCGPELVCDIPSSHEVTPEKFKQIMLEALKEWLKEGK